MKKGRGKDKQKRKSRLKTALGIGVGIGLGATAIGGAYLLSKKVKLKPQKFGKNINPDIADPKDKLSFEFADELKKRRKKKADEEYNKVIDFWNKHQSPNPDIGPPRKPYGKKDGEGFNFGKKLPLTVQVLGGSAAIGGVLGLNSKRRQLDKNESFKNRALRNYRQVIPATIMGGLVGASLSSPLGGADQIVRNMKWGGIIGAGGMTGYATSKLLRDTALNQYRKQKEKRKK